MRHAIQRVHFVGIGGAGMSGIAEVLLNQGYQVSGSDLHESETTRRLRGLGARVLIGHEAAHASQADVVVTSSAVHPDNPEVQLARSRRVPVIPRAMMLGELMRFRKGIAIAGTHGKTTTTSLTASVLARAGLDPTFVIGGVLNAARASARMGSGEYIVAEADESDASFLHLLPVIAVITNIDSDHMDTYGQSVEKLRQAFVDFTRQLPFYGHAVVCQDDPGVRAIMPSITKTVITYGLDASAQVSASQVQATAQGMRFVVRRDGLLRRGYSGSASNSQPSGNGEALPISLRLHGVHNVRNALAAITVASLLEVPDESITQALAEFSGVGRRMQSYGDIGVPARAGKPAGHFTLVDDYGHHPAEIEATIAAVRGAYAGRRLLVVFQPHRFTRTRDLFEDFVRTLSLADALLLTEVYPAGETPIQAATGRDLSRALRLHGKVEPVFVEQVEDLPAAVGQHARAGDVVLVLGAGSIGRVAARVRELAAAEASSTADTHGGQA